MPQKKPKFYIGQMVQAPAPLHRFREYRNGIHYKTWKTLPRSTSNPVVGHFIGHRLYKNGYVKYYEEGELFFNTTEFLKIGLIVPGPRNKPIPVRFDLIEPLFP